MQIGTKPEMIVLRRVNIGIKNDPQFSPYLTGNKYCVFYQYGHPSELGCSTFRTKKEARHWITERKPE